MDTLRTLSLAMSSPALEREYRRLHEGLQRTPGELPGFDPSRWSAAALAAARSTWVERMCAEHRSFPVFTLLATQLSEAGATLEMEAVMLRMATDEIRHTELCGLVVRTLGEDPSCVAVRAVPPLARHPGCSPEERALRNVIYTTCLSEMVAVARFVEALDAMEDPFLSECTRRLLADEVLHGQFGFHYLEAWLPWLGKHPEVCDSIERYLRGALCVLERELAGTSPHPWSISDEERALGCPDPCRAREVFHTTLEGAVLPALERYGIRAQRAWRERRLPTPPSP
jgi:hypothetical protein